MARRIRIPLLVDLTLVDEPSEIRALARMPELNRRFTVRGPLFNRLIARRIHRWFQVDGVPLPALAPREDAARAERQQSLHAALQPTAGVPLWTEAQIDRLAEFLRGQLGRDDLGVTVQEIVGRRFDPDYAADRGSWAAAEMIDAFRDGGPLTLPRDLFWIVTGKLRRARALLLERARHDRTALHGTAIGVHGIFRALDRMRALRGTAAGGSISPETAIGRCLHPPQRVPRTVETIVATPVTPAPLRPGAMVMLQLESAGLHAPDAEMIFMQGHWSYCPAESFIPALLHAAWQRAQ